MAEKEKVVVSGKWGSLGRGLLFFVISLIELVDSFKLWTYIV